MNPRTQRSPSGAAHPSPTRGPIAPIHRGPQAQPSSGAFQHAPNAALLIDFDNVTMGIRSDLAAELRQLLASEIIRGKVAVQRAYADWRRYPQYVVPLAESSIDMIMAPAYGSSKKNATDIRLAVDAIELVFTRPEIGTFILLSGDSDFASLVTKLKEYGKYVIGVGIRESSSDLLVMNCDEYYSYNALAGLVKSAEEEVVRKDPWELVTQAITRMVEHDDVMRSDRLKQVMQDIDPSFAEKDLGFPKFSRFCQEAAARGLITVTRLENGQFAVGPAGEAPPAPAPSKPAPERASRDEEKVDRDGRRRRGRGRRGRTDKPEGRESAPATAGDTPAEVAPEPAPVVEQELVVGRDGERLTRVEAFDLVRRAAEALVDGDGFANARDVRIKAYELLNRDSESLSERNFPRILKDTHDAGIIDLRRRGEDYEVSLPETDTPIAEQLNRAAAALSPGASAAPPARGLVSRGIGGRGRGRSVTPPPDLFSVGVVDDVPAADSEDTPAASGAGKPAAKTASPARKRTARKTAAKSARKGTTRTAAKTVTKTAAKTADKSPSPVKKTAKKAARKSARKTARKASSTS